MYCSILLYMRERERERERLFETEKSLSRVESSIQVDYRLIDLLHHLTLYLSFLSFKK